MHSTRLATLLAAAALAACSIPTDRAAPPAAETLHAVTVDDRLVSFDAHRPGTLLSDRPIAGLQPGERVLGIDYRVARGELYALGSSGRLYRVDPDSAAASPVGAPFAVPLAGTEFGFDFNPTVDRIRVVSDAGLNLRLHPDTGAVVDGDPNAAGLQTDGALAYDASDRNAGRAPAVTAAGYTYNKVDEKITTNYAIDARQGTLVIQGSREGAQPAVSPNTGRLSTVGPLGAGPIARASFDIGDVRNVAYAALAAPGASAAVLYRVDLGTGAATRIGPIGGGRPVTGIAIQP
ncbi:MAG TPA: DUF4394 domain-containing protein [Burkholderiaceae bacterium]|nr:DUF4394 domain-containing protein [Burkholderiaceae bacterium]